MKKKKFLLALMMATSIVCVPSAVAEACVNNNYKSACMDTNMYAGISNMMSVELNKEYTEPMLMYTNKTTQLLNKDLSVVDNVFPNVAFETFEIDNGYSMVKLSGIDEFYYIKSEYLSETKSKIEDLNRWNISLTKEEMQLLANIVWVEARGESDEGKQAVVEVVFNRMVSDKYPDDLYSVLSQSNPTQFSSWKLRDKASPTDSEYLAIMNVMYGNTNILPIECDKFSTKPQTKNIAATIGNHYFCI